MKVQVELALARVSIALTLASTKYDHLKQKANSKRLFSVLLWGFRLVKGKPWNFNEEHQL